MGINSNKRRAISPFSFLGGELIMYDKSVSINLTSKCNATCDHCCFSCSPK
ncbi:hypothetical protein I0614_000169, partial [Staphylococcus pseudintermedius]|nr:hypothetical protein [Staphylococcus pseudintermedius]